MKLQYIDALQMFDYVGKLLPTKIILRTRIPAQWLESESFRKEIWERINKRIPKGKISENKDGKDQFFNCCVLYRRDPKIRLDYSLLDQSLCYPQKLNKTKYGRTEFQFSKLYKWGPYILK